MRSITVILFLECKVLSLVARFNTFLAVASNTLQSKDQQNGLHKTNHLGAFQGNLTLVIPANDWPYASVIWHMIRQSKINLVYTQVCFLYNSGFTSSPPTVCGDVCTARCSRGKTKMEGRGVSLIFGKYMCNSLHSSETCPGFFNLFFFKQEATTALGSTDTGCPGYLVHQ